jgi:hypothetical protein
MLQAPLKRSRETHTRRPSPPGSPRRGRHGRGRNRRLCPPEAHAFCADVEVRLSRARTLDVDPAGQLGERRVEIGDAQRNMLQRTALPWTLSREERELAPPRVRAEQRELVGLVDHVHPEVRREEVRDGLALREPVRDMVELRRVHAEDGTQRGMGYAELFATIDGALQLLLRHPRAALDSHALRLVVQLLLGAPLRPLGA